MTQVKESIDEELKAENIADLTPVQERLTETRKQILELFKYKKSGQFHRRIQQKI